MKRVIKSIMLVSIFSIIAGYSCSNKNENKEDENPNPNEEVEYPIEIPFEDYSLAGTSCKWKRFQGKTYEYELITIKNNEDLDNYIECTGESSYPEIDFSKYTLLLARGIASSTNKVGYYSLQQFSEQGYEMKVDVFLTHATIISYWQVPIIVNKLSEGYAIELIVTHKSI